MNNNINGSSEKYTLIVGLGYFERELVSHLRDKRSVKVVDIKESRVSQLNEQYPDVEFISGDSSSLVTWKKLDTQAISHVIITVRDKDIVHETCRLIREFLKLEILIIVISYDDFDTHILDEFNVTVVRPIQMGMDIIANLLDKNVSWPINIGNRDGEIVEVLVLKNSHLIGVKLKHIRPVSWNIALIYVDGKPQLPNANTRIHVGDRVVLVGEPNILKGVIDTLTKGEPNFPLQFGQNIALYVCQQHTSLLDEAIYMQKHTMAKKIHILPIGGKVPKGTADTLKSEKVEFLIGDNINSYEDVLSLKEGIIVMPKRRDMFSGRYYQKLMKNAASPLLFTAGHEKYDKVIISLNTETPAFALETGVELAKLLVCKFSVLYIKPVENVRGQKDVDYLNFRKSLIADFELSDGVTIDHLILEGNPVIETISQVDKYEGENCLLVMTFDPDDKISFFSPNVPYLITKKAGCSVLAIPVEDTDA